MSKPRHHNEVRRLKQFAVLDNLFSKKEPPPKKKKEEPFVEPGQIKILTKEEVRAQLNSVKLT